MLLWLGQSDVEEVTSCKAIGAVAVWAALLKEAVEAFQYQIVPSPECSARRSSPNESRDHVAEKLSRKASGSRTSGSPDGYLGVPYTSPPVIVPVESSKFVTPSSPPYSRAPKPSPGIKKSSWLLKLIAPAGTEDGEMS